MKYEFTEQSQGVFNFSQADQFVALAHAHNITKIRCHNLIWHNELPAWSVHHVRFYAVEVSN